MCLRTLTALHSLPCYYIYTTTPPSDFSFSLIYKRNQTDYILDILSG